MNILFCKHRHIDFRTVFSASLFVVFLFSSLFCYSLPTNANPLRTIRVGYFAFDNYHNQEEDGTRDGYGYEYLQAMSSYANWDYEYIGYDKSWAEMLTMLDNGEIDLLTSAQKTPERVQKYDYSALPIGSSSVNVTVREGETKYRSDNYSDWDGIRVGMIAGSTRNISFDTFASENDFTYKPIIYDDLESMILALQDATEIDAIVTSSLRATNQEWIVAQFDSSPFYVIVKKGNTELLREIDYALEQLSISKPGLQNELYAKYYSAPNQNLSFTSEERNLIQSMQENGESLAAVIKPDCMPLSGYENGVPCGIMTDLAQFLEDAIGIPITIIPVSSQEEYNRVLQNGSVDLALDATLDLNLAEKMNCYLTSPYLEVPYIQISLKSHANSVSKIALAENDRINDTLLGLYNQKSISVYSTRSACINAVLAGTADACYLDTYAAQNISDFDETNRLKLYSTLERSPSLCIAVSNTSDQMLYPIIQKAICSLSEDALNQMIMEHSELDRTSTSLIGLLYSNPLLVLALVIMGFVILILAMMARNRSKRQQEECIRANENERFLLQLCKSFDIVKEYNFSTHEITLFEIDCGAIIQSELEWENPEEQEKFYHPDDRFKIKELCASGFLLDLIRNEDEIYLELRRLVPSSKEKCQWFSVTLQGVKKDFRHPMNLLVLQKDITKAKEEERRSRQALEDALLTAQQASAVKGNFMSKISHEIRTPLNAVIGYTTMAKNSINDPVRVATCLAKSQLAAKHLLNVINDVLDITSLESGKMKISHELFDLKEQINSISEMFYMQTSQKNIHFEVILNGIRHEMLVGDSLRLNQILLNLLSNAVKFTPDGGEITLYITQVSESPRNSLAHFEFKVEDSGIGMSAEFMDRIFTPFEQEDASTAKNFGGTGLGLSIAHNLVDLMQGKISVKSRLEQGTTFIVELPFEYDDSAQHNIANLDFSNLHALIVDDEESTCEYMSDLLKRFGIRNEYVMSGEAALKIIKEAATRSDYYDLCLMDWIMPGLDGLETIREIRQTPSAKLPIIIITAYDSSEIIDSAKEMGVHTIAAKPLFQSSLFNLLVDTYGSYIPHSKRSATEIDFTGCHLLLAEDNAMNMEIACEFLSDAGFTIDQATNGQEAILTFQNAAPNTYDAILMDIMMPIINGYEATKAIRSSNHPQARTIPIIALTANAFAEDVSAAIVAGFDDHIAKPLDLEELFSTLAKYIKWNK